MGKNRWKNKCHEAEKQEKYWWGQWADLYERYQKMEKVVEAFKNLRKIPIICDLNGNYGDECSSNCIFIEICGIIRQHDEGREEIKNDDE